MGEDTYYVNTREITEIFSGKNRKDMVYFYRILWITKAVNRKEGHYGK